MPETNSNTLYDRDGDAWVQGKNGLWYFKYIFVEYDPVTREALGFPLFVIENSYGPLTTEPPTKE